MKKKIYLSILLVGISLAYIGYEKQFSWFTLENIQINAEERRIEGNCIDGNYSGEMVIIVPKSININQFENGMTIKVKGGPAMTMSLPPQLMSTKKIKIIK